MATFTSAHLSISAGADPDSVVVSVHGTLDITAAARLKDLLDGLLEDRDILAVRVDLHHVRGVDVGGISGLAAAAERADERGAELTLRDPPQVLLPELESEGLTGLIRTGRQDRPTRRSSIERRQAQSQHPSCGLLLVDGPDLGHVHGI